MGKSRQKKLQARQAKSLNSNKEKMPRSKKLIVVSILMAISSTALYYAYHNQRQEGEATVLRKDVFVPEPDNASTWDELDEVEQHTLFVFGDIVKNHESKKINTDLVDLLENKVVWLQAYPYHPKDAIASFMISESREEIKRPTLFLSTKWFRPPFASRELLAPAVLHEYVHIDQWRSGRFPAESFLESSGYNITLEKFKLTILKEIEAYLVQCQYAKEYGLIQPNDVCDVLYSQGKSAMVDLWLTWEIDKNFPEALPYKKELRQLALDYQRQH